MVNVGTFYDHLEYFMTIWYNLWTFGTVCGHLLYFTPISYAWTKKNQATQILIRRGAVDIASASGTRRPGFESRQGRMFLGKHGSAVVYKMT
jgi:hypothetical protein